MKKRLLTWDSHVRKRWIIPLNRKLYSETLFESAWRRINFLWFSSIFIHDSTHTNIVNIQIDSWSSKKPLSWLLGAKHKVSSFTGCLWRISLKRPESDIKAVLHLRSLKICLRNSVWYSMGHFWSQLSP